MSSPRRTTEPQQNHQPHRVAMTPGAHRALEAASRLFYERGIHAVGVDLIAAEAGVTKKTLYDRFGSKEQIVVEYLAARDERWRAFLAERLKAKSAKSAKSAKPEEPEEDDPAERILAVFDASRAWAEANGARGCSMINARAEISDPAHPAYAIITGQKRWMLALFTDLARRTDRITDRNGAERLGRTLMLLHEGALATSGLGVIDDPFTHAGDQARSLLGTGA